jgi:hypothetical protein
VTDVAIATQGVGLVFDAEFLFMLKAWEGGGIRAWRSPIPSDRNSSRQSHDCLRASGLVPFGITATPCLRPTICYPSSKRKSVADHQRVGSLLLFEQQEQADRKGTALTRALAGGCRA